MERRKVWIGAEPVAWRAGKANGEMGERLEVELGCVCVREAGGGCPQSSQGML